MPSNLRRRRKTREQKRTLHLLPKVFVFVVQETMKRRDGKKKKKRVGRPNLLFQVLAVCVVLCVVVSNQSIDQISYR
jgi:hypothetical protein